MASEGHNEIKVPTLGESIREATVSRWLKATGEAVKVDEALVELETDKVTLEVNAPISGFLGEIQAGEGATVAVGDILGFITQAEGSPLSSTPVSLSQKGAPTDEKTISTANKAGLDELAPAVRKLAEELSVNVEKVVGTGRGGRITKEDVVHFSEGKVAESEPPILELQSSAEATVELPIRTSPHREERVRMTRLRQRIAERLKHAQNTAAILTTFNEVDMSAITALRNAYKDSFEKKHGVRLGIMSFFVKACVQALKQFPAVNAEIDGDEIIYKNYYDMGVAVSTPQGLVVPIVRDADTLNFAGIEKTIASLAQKARDGKLSIAEMTGGTFSISNGGIFGSLLATPILNPPQTGILGMHKIEDRPIVIQGKIEVRPMMYLALSYDHRVIDGRESVSFLVKVKENLENPERLLLDM